MPMEDENDFYLWIHSEVMRLGFNTHEIRLGKDTSAGLGEIGLDKRNNEWCVYNFERGNESRMARFNSRRDAVYFFFLQLMISKGDRIYPSIDFRLAPAEK